MMGAANSAIVYMLHGMIVLVEFPATLLRSLGLSGSALLLIHSGLYHIAVLEAIVLNGSIVVVGVLILKPAVWDVPASTGKWSPLGLPSLPCSRCNDASSTILNSQEGIQAGNSIMNSAHWKAVLLLSFRLYWQCP
jgi:hypothetical protein